MAAVLRARAEVGREGGALSPALSGRIGARRGGGQPLDATVRRGMEGVFGVDFSPVRIHADPEADALNRGVAAIAFTVGSDIFFRAGAYQPHSAAGQHLLAHELTHVVQQRTGSLGTSGGGGNAGGTMTVGAADDRHEVEAEQTAHRVTAALQARGPALTAPATSPGAALSRVHDPAVALAPAAPGIARAAAPSWPAPPINKTGLVPLAVPCPGAIIAGNGTSLPLAAPVLATARVIPQPLPVGAPVLLLGHDGAVGGSGWSYVRLVAQPWAGREGWVSSSLLIIQVALSPRLFTVSPLSDAWLLRPVLVGVPMAVFILSRCALTSGASPPSSICISTALRTPLILRSLSGGRPNRSTASLIGFNWATLCRSYRIGSGEGLQVIVLLPLPLCGSCRAHAVLPLRDSDGQGPGLQCRPWLRHGTRPRVTASVGR